MRIDLEVLNSFDLIITTRTMQSGDESSSSKRDRVGHHHEQVAERESENEYEKSWSLVPLLSS